MNASLQILCTYIEGANPIQVNEPVIVMNTGGTNFRVALRYILMMRPVIFRFLCICNYPGTKGRVTQRDEFFF